MFFPVWVDKYHLICFRCHVTCSVLLQEDDPTPSSTSSHPASQASQAPSVHGIVPYGGAAAYDDESPAHISSRGYASSLQYGGPPHASGPGEELSPTEEVQLLRRQVRQSSGIRVF